MDRIHQRIDTPTERPDIMTPVLKYRPDSDERVMSVPEIGRTGWILIFAGAETAAGLLTAAVSYLIRKPAKLQKLTRELRSAFNDRESITFRGTVVHPYLDAVLHECLRLVPPVAGPSPRVVDEDGYVICGQVVPKGVCTSFHESTA